MLGNLDPGEWELVSARRTRELDVMAREGRVVWWGGYVRPLSVSADFRFRRLQRALGVKVDGLLGYQTSRAVAELGFPALSHPATMAEYANTLIAYLETRKAYLATAAT